jgi:magnesium-protoporphyrin O-methyltransferase
VRGCCNAAVAERHFGSDKARDELEDYRSGGPDSLTRIALAMLGTQPIADVALLDVGGGIGVLGRELLGGPVTDVTIVEESSAYLSVAREQAERDGTLARWRFVQGDFVDLVADVGRTDLATLHRVVCCYPDYEALLDAVAATGARWVLLSYPRERWYVRAALWLEDLANRVRGDPFRSAIHPEEGIARRMHDGGYRRVSDVVTWFWRVEVYAGT